MNTTRSLESIKRTMELLELPEELVTELIREIGKASRSQGTQGAYSVAFHCFEAIRSRGIELKPKQALDFKEEVAFYLMSAPTEEEKND